MYVHIQCHSCTEGLQQRERSAFETRLARELASAQVIFHNLLLQ